MPLLAWATIFAIAAGAGGFGLGKGIDAAGEGVRDAAIGVAVLGGAFIIAKKAKVI